ncbi:hypothetical protein [Actinoplanes sp. CA-252034]|uniref:hypothetical protein n=1 Tax=Actinoplanes sp. CA-252034 TaxID=3239906 RepID=UPI003D97FAA1
MRAEIPPLADRLRLIAWCSAPGLAAAVGSFRAWPLRWVCLGIVVGVFLVAVARQRPGRPAGKPAEKGPLRDALGFLLFLASIVFAFVALNVARPGVLGLVGRPDVAYIGARDAEKVPTRSSREKIEYCYHLLRADGSEMTGRVCRDDRSYDRGEAVEVMIEPTGLIAPETRAEVVESAWIANIGVGAFAVICVAALLGGGPAAPERSLIPPGRYPVWRPGPRPLERRPRRRPRRNRRR